MDITFRHYFYNEYYKNLCKNSKLKLELLEKNKSIKDSENINIILINGFLNENETDISEWEYSLSALRWQKYNWYYFKWQSQSMLDIFWTKVDPTTINKLAWKNALDNTKPAGEFLAKAIIKSKDQKFILCGHSLGARVIHHIIKNIDSLESKSMEKIKEVHLLGGAVGYKKSNWEFVDRYENLNIYNYYSSNDDVLKFLYTAGTLGDKAIGRNKIDTKKINNVDVTKKVNGHSEYKKNFSYFYISKSNNKSDKCKINIKG